MPTPRKKTADQVIGRAAGKPVNPMYMSWDGKLVPDAAERSKAFAAMNDAVEAFSGVYRSTAGWHQDFSNLAPNVSGRPGLTRDGYERFRPGEAVPVKPKDILMQCDSMYQRVGLIRNIIDLMGDFTTQGVRVVHPNKRIEKFYQNWWKRVSGDSVSERFANLSYRLANVPIKWQTAKIRASDQDKINRSVATPDMEIEHLKTPSKEIPWNYVFLHPACLETVGGPLASFVGSPVYGIKLPDNLRRIITAPRTDEESALVSKLPADIIEASRASKPVILDPDKTRVFFYKKDDWQEWALPITYAIMDDIFLLEKLKLADFAALDGAISNIRIIKIGSLEHKIAPTRAAAQKLSEILESHTGVGTLDLVWGPDIEMLESSTTVHQFLGEGKYTATLNNIYAGLGIPPTLTGTFGASGTTNNYISLQTLVQRLEYGRSLLRQFWEEQFEIVRQAMGFRFAAKLEFDMPNLGDIQAMYKLLIDLSDRELISDELLRQKFKHDPEMERVRVNRESRDREEGRLVKKASPFHDPQFELAIKKIFAQTGVVTPSELGIELEEKKAGEKPALDMKAPPGVPGVKGPAAKKKGVPGQGRPKNKKDSTKRKTKTFTPRSKAVLEIWAGVTQAAIAEVVNPLILERFQKKNMRSLTNEEAAIAERIRFETLWNLTPMGEVSEATILAALQAGGVHEKVFASSDSLIAGISKDLNRKLTLDEIRTVQAAMYARYYGEGV